MQFPRMLRIRQRFDDQHIADIPAEVRRQLALLNLEQRVRPGETVAITAGSRGIANVAIILRTVIDCLRERGAIPFIVPAMGSHGGGTAEGQVQILAGYGITPEFLGVEIRASMETVIVDHTPHGIPVHFDLHASRADHVLVVGRIKPHTGFVGDIESGLHKMLLIGLGKHNGAIVYHQAIQDYNWPEIVQSVANAVLRRCKVLGGLGIVENAYDQTGLIEAVRPENFYAREVELLKLARKWLPRLPFTQVDLLILDEIGKNISGTGMDTNVIGRKYNDHKPTNRDEFKVKTIFVRGLTEATHGNACGLGIAEFTNARTVATVDRRITAINAITGGHTPAAAIPVAYDTDRDVLKHAFPTIGLTPPEKARVVQIRNTLELKEVLVSEAYLPALAERPDLEVLAEPSPMKFDAEENLLPV